LKQPPLKITRYEINQNSQLLTLDLQPPIYNAHVLAIFHRPWPLFEVTPTQIHLNGS